MVVGLVVGWVVLLVHVLEVDLVVETELRMGQ